MNDQCKVLIVDDDPTIRQLAVNLVEDVGGVAITASNGAEALTTVLRERPNVIVLDIDMPVMDGREFYRQLASLGRLVPTLVISAFAAARAAEEIGADGSLQKPFDIDDFIDSVQALCAISHGSVDACLAEEPCAGT